MNEWISIEEDLPNENELVLAADEFNDFISLARFSEDEYEFRFKVVLLDNVEIDSIITHWMRLPNLPKAKNDII